MTHREPTGVVLDTPEGVRDFGQGLVVTFEDKEGRRVTARLRMARGSVVETSE